MPSLIADTTMNSVFFTTVILCAQPLLFRAPRWSSRLGWSYNSTDFVTRHDACITPLTPIWGGINQLGICFSVFSCQETFLAEFIHILSGREKGCSSMRARQPINLPVSARTAAGTNIHNVGSICRYNLKFYVVWSKNLVTSCGRYHFRQPFLSRRHQNCIPRHGSLFSFIEFSP